MVFFVLFLAREWVNGASDTAKIVGLFGEPFWSTIISKSYLWNLKAWHIPWLDKKFLKCVFKTSNCSDTKNLWNDLKYLTGPKIWIFLS